MSARCVLHVIAIICCSYFMRCGLHLASGTNCSHLIWSGRHYFQLSVIVKKVIKFLLFAYDFSLNGVCSGIVVSILVCQSRGSGFKSWSGQKFGSRFLLLLCPSAMMSALTIHCQWEDEMVREKIGHLPTYAEAKKMTLLTLLPMVALGLA